MNSPTLFGRIYYLISGYRGIGLIWVATKYIKKLPNLFPAWVSASGIFYNPINDAINEAEKIKRETLVSKIDFQRHLTNMALCLPCKVFTRAGKHHPLSFENNALITLAMKRRIAISISKKPLRGAKS
jgi:hypothetical protein